MTIKLITKLLAISLTCVFSAAVSAQSFRPLSEAREAIVFDELTADEKIRLAEQTQLILQDVYVNRLAKQDFYPDLRDPLVDVAEVVASASELSTEELEIRLAKIVLSQRDFHLRYTLPAPYGRFTSILPLAFERTSRQGNPFEVRVRAVNEALIEQFAENQRVPEVGDLVVSYNGQRTRDAIEAIIPVGGGANTWGGFKRAMDLLAFRRHANDLLPEEDTVSLQLRSRRSGDLYSVNLPWLSSTSFVSGPVDRFQATNEAADETNVLDTPLNMMMDEWEMERKKAMEMAGLSTGSQYPSTPTDVEELTWGIIDNRFGTFGYIRIDNFGTGFGSDILFFAVEELRSLLLNELKDTDGLIIDVRNNPGGIVDIAETFQQLFGGREAELSEYQAVNSDTNRVFLSSGIFGNGPAEALESVADTDEIFSDRFTLTPLFGPEIINEEGQIYFKPVGVLMNARSYSAADTFTCSMQDDGRAILYGEDLRTGAGGATVVAHSFISGSGAPFERLPARHELRTALFQIFRDGLNAGQLIEDFGCEADVDVSPVADDLVSGNATQIDKITRDLARRALRFDAFSQAQPINDLDIVGVDANRPVFSINTRGTRSVRIYRENVLVSEASVFSGFRFERNEFDLAGIIEPGVNSFVLRGVDYRGDESWNYKLEIVPLNLDVESVSVGTAGVTFDFSQAESIEPLSILNVRDQDEWVLETPFLQVGPAAEGGNTEIVLRLDLSALDSAELAVDIGLRTSFFNDLDIYITTGEVFASQRSVLLELSGRESFDTRVFSLNEFAGQENVYVHFRYRNTLRDIAPGVQIGKIVVR